MKTENIYNFNWTLYGKVTNIRAVHVCIYARITIRFRFWFIIYVIPHVKASCSHNASTNGLRVRFSRHQYNSYWYSSLLILIRGLIFVWKGDLLSLVFTSCSSSYFPIPCYLPVSGSSARGMWMLQMWQCSIIGEGLCNVSESVYS